MSIKNYEENIQFLEEQLKLLNKSSPSQNNSSQLQENKQENLKEKPEKITPFDNQREIIKKISKSLVASWNIQKDTQNNSLNLDLNESIQNEQSYTYQALKFRYEQLQQEFSSKIQRILQLEQSLNDKDQLILGLKNQITELQNNIKQFREDYIPKFNKQQQQLEIVQVEFVALENDNQILEQQIERLKSENKQFYSSNQIYLKEIDVLKQQQLKDIQVINQYEIEIETLQQENLMQKELNSNSIVENKRLQNQIEKLNSILQVNNIQLSHLWNPGQENKQSKIIQQLSFDQSSK